MKKRRHTPRVTFKIFLAPLLSLRQLSRRSDLLGASTFRPFDWTHPRLSGNNGESRRGRVLPPSFSHVRVKIFAFSRLPLVHPSVLLHAIAVGRLRELRIGVVYSIRHVFDPLYPSPFLTGKNFFSDRTEPDGTTIKKERKKWRTQRIIMLLLIREFRVWFFFYFSITRRL